MAAPGIMQACLGVSTYNSNQGQCTRNLVQTPSGVWYWIFRDSGGGLAFQKSTDGGYVWSAPVVITSTGNSAVTWAVWYDRWSNISAGLIHIAYTIGTGHDTLYRTIDTENSDALSTETTIFNGASVGSGGSLTIARARGGNVYCRTCIDNGAEGGFFRLPNANVPNGAWDAARTINEALASSDSGILLPGWAADDQDMMLIFWDASADEISRQLYDDSGNSWSETSISTSMVDQTWGTASGGAHFSATVDIANSRNIVVAWNGVDTSNADLLGWFVTESAITAFTTPVVSNGTDDQGLCAIGLDTDTGYLWVWYGGKSDGSETFLTDINLYLKVSTDGGATWGTETRVTADTFTQDIRSLYTIPRFTQPWAVVRHELDATASTHMNAILSAPLRQARAQSMLGI